MIGVDMNDDGEINYNEFLAFSLDRKKLLSRTNLETAFKTFDKVNLLLNSQDNNGKISLEEIANIFNNNAKEADEKEIFSKLISGADTDGDGEVSLHEFIAIMEKFINVPTDKK